MGPKELSRLRKIDKHLLKLKKAYRRVHYRHHQVTLEKKALEASIKTLEAERDALVQGQLIFPGSG